MSYRLLRSMSATDSGLQAAIEREIRRQAPLPGCKELGRGREATVTLLGGFGVWVSDECDIALTWLPVMTSR